MPRETPEERRRRCALVAGATVASAIVLGNEARHVGGAVSEMRAGARIGSVIGRFFGLGGMIGGAAIGAFVAYIVYRANDPGKSNAVQRACSG